MGPRLVLELSEAPLMFKLVQTLSNISLPLAHLTDGETETQKGEGIENWGSGLWTSRNQETLTLGHPYTGLL